MGNPSKEIEREQAELLAEYESLVLDLSNTHGIVYSRDINIEAQVKYDYLCDMYGREMVEEHIKPDFVDQLSDQTIFNDMEDGFKILGKYRKRNDIINE
jgi:hypothetical protein